MIISLLTYLGRLILVLLFQVLIINNLEVSTYINPFVYVLFILTLPYSLKPWQVVLLSAFTGMIIDTFSNTPGLHMAATIFMGYIRGFYLKFAAGKEDLSGTARPSLSQKGWFWFTIYTFILTYIHHNLLFILEIFSFKEFFSTIFRALMSSLFTVLIIVLLQLLFYKPAQAR